MKRENIFISTIAADDTETARRYGFGLEIAEYCTAWNMDDSFEETDASVCGKMKGISRFILHAPFSELFPCAIDPKARALAKERYIQAAELSKKYGAEKIVIHAGFNERLYYPEWFTEQSVIFWRDFLKELKGIQIVLENVLEPQPALITDILKEVNEPDLKMCLDIGHVNAYSDISVFKWLEECAGFISHFHIHNNDGSFDTHSAFNEGSIPVKEFLDEALRLCPEATFTLELTEAEPSVKWLEKNRLI